MPREDRYTHLHTTCRTLARDSPEAGGWPLTKGARLMRGVWGIFDRAVTNTWILPTTNFRIREVYLYTHLWRGAVLVGTVRPEIGYANTVLSFEQSVAGWIPVPRVFTGVLSGLIQAVLSVLPTLRLRYDTIDRVRTASKFLIHRPSNLPSPYTQGTIMIMITRLTPLNTFSLKALDTEAESA